MICVYFHVEFLQIVNRLKTDKYAKLKVKAEIIELNSSITLPGIYGDYTCCSVVVQVFYECTIRKPAVFLFGPDTLGRVAKAVLA